MMVRLHLNSQKDLFCHQLYLQRAALEDELEYETVWRNRRFYRHPVESASDSASESILDAKDSCNLNGNLDNLNDTEDNGAVVVESDIEHG
jgi:hypothetical protein